MTKIIFAALLFVFFPLKVEAQSVSVRSGEHDSFTRIVLDVALPTDWKILRESPNVFRLDLFERNDRIDITRAFDKIPKNRVADITVDTDRGMEITLNCNCDIEPFEFNGNMIVLDIYEKSENQLFAARANESLSNSAFQLGSMKTLLARSNTRHSFEPTFIEQDQWKDSELTREIRRQIANDLQAAIGMGLLRTELEEQAHNRKEQPETKQDKQKLETKQTETSRLSSVQKTTKLSERVPILEVQNFETNCIGDEDINIIQWRDQLTLNVLMQQMNLAIFSDNTSEDEVMRIVKSLISYGMGSEAKNLASLLKLDLPEYIVGIANVVEDKNSKTEHMSSLLDCDGDVSVWSALSLPDESVRKDALKKIQTSQLPFLPPELREIVSKIRERKISINAVEEKTAMRNFEDSKSEETLHFLNQSADTSRKDLIIRDLDPNSDLAKVLSKYSAIIRNSKKILAAELKIDLDEKENLDIDTLSALELEYKGTTYQEPVQLLLIDAYLNRNKYRNALGYIMNKSFENADTKVLASFVSYMAAKRTNNIEFLEIFASPFAKNFSENVHLQIKLDIAMRLERMGFNKSIETWNVSEELKAIGVKESMTASSNLNTQMTDAISDMKNLPRENQQTTEQILNDENFIYSMGNKSLDATEIRDESEKKINQNHLRNAERILKESFEIKNLLENILQ